MSDIFIIFFVTVMSIFIGWLLWPFASDRCANKTVVETSTTHRVVGYHALTGTTLVECREPELSCFVKGIIRSMRETPDEWRYAGLCCYHYPSDSTRPDLCLRRERSNYQPSGYLPWYVENQKLTDAEREAIGSQGIAHLQSVAAKKADNERVAARAPFERLGCPENEG